MWIMIIRVLNVIMYSDGFDVPNSTAFVPSVVGLIIAESL